MGINPILLSECWVWGVHVHYVTYIIEKIAIVSSDEFDIVLYELLYLICLQGTLKLFKTL